MSANYSANNHFVEKNVLLLALHLHFFAPIALGAINSQSFDLYEAMANLFQSFHMDTPASSAIKMRGPGAGYFCRILKMLGH